MRPVAEQPQRGVELQAHPDLRGVATGRRHGPLRGLGEVELRDVVHHQRHPGREVRVTGQPQQGGAVGGGVADHDVLADRRLAVLGVLRREPQGLGQREREDAGEARAAEDVPQHRPRPHRLRRHPDRLAARPADEVGRVRAPGRRGRRRRTAGRGRRSPRRGRRRGRGPRWNGSPVQVRPSHGPRDRRSPTRTPHWSVAGAVFRWRWLGSHAGLQSGCSCSTTRTPEGTDVQRDPVEPAPRRAPVPAPARVRASRPSPSAELYEEAAADRLAFWDEQARTLSLGDRRGTQTLDWSDAPFAKWFVGGKLNVALQLRRPARRGRQRRPGRDPLRGRARRHPHDHLRRPASARCSKAANALTDLGVHDRRPGRDLPADDPRGGRRDAGVRPDRRHRTRWSSAASPPRRCAAGSTTRRPSSSSPPTAATAAASRRRSSPRSTRPSTQHAVGAQRARRPAHRPGRRVDRRAATSGGTTSSTRRATSTTRSRSTPSTRCSSSTPRARPGSRRASCTPPAAT